MNELFPLTRAVYLFGYRGGNRRDIEETPGILFRRSFTDESSTPLGFEHRILSGLSGPSSKVN